MSTLNSAFYVIGGTLRHDARSYVERKADKDLYDGLAQGEFCYVLTSRQMGKSSLMVRTAARLRAESVAVAVIDLTAIGQNLVPEQWYNGLLGRMGRQFGLEDELEEFWAAHARFSPLQRFITAIHDVILTRTKGRVVIFIDEIDTVRSLPFSTDEFFAAIRECYNRRTEDAEFNRVTFCLLGVATPSDLIRDTRTTPFNIGRRIELNDFSQTEVMPLAAGLGREPAIARSLLERIFYWTAGHPYLTQRLCQVIAEDPAVVNISGVDQHCQMLFLSNRARERDDNLLFVRERLLRSESDPTSVLELYARIHKGKPVRDDETSPLISLLRLSGITKVQRGLLRVRNRIYSSVFDLDWILANIPDAEARRQRAAFRRGLLRGSAVVGGIALLLLTLVALGFSAREDYFRAQAVRTLGSAYRHLRSYQDHTLIEQEVKTGNMKATFQFESSIMAVPPNKVVFSVKGDMGAMRVDAQLVSDGSNLWIYLPIQNEYSVTNAPRTFEEIFEHFQPVATMASLALKAYRYVLSPDPVSEFDEIRKQIRVTGEENIDGNPAYILTWSEELSDPETLGRPSRGGRGRSRGRPPMPPVPPPPAPLGRYPVKAWVSKNKGIILQNSVNYSDIYRVLTNGPRAALANPQNEMLVTEKHTKLVINEPLPRGSFKFTPPPGARKVPLLAHRPDSMMSGQFKKPFSPAELAQKIPARAANLPVTSLDLTPYYNAPLTENWTSSGSNAAANNLASLPRGWQTFAGTPFDVRGIIQLSGRELLAVGKRYPDSVEITDLPRAVQRIHLLLGTAWTAPSNSVIASGVLKYANRQRWEFPIIYNEHVVDWWQPPGPTKTGAGSVVAWTGTNEASVAANRSLRLFKVTWDNPLPQHPIEALEFRSRGQNAAPFIVAVTVE